MSGGARYRRHRPFTWKLSPYRAPPQSRPIRRFNARRQRGFNAQTPAAAPSDKATIRAQIAVRLARARSKGRFADSQSPVQRRRQRGFNAQTPAAAPSDKAAIRAQIAARLARARSERPIRRFSITGPTPPSTRIQRPDPRSGTIGQGNHSGRDRRPVGSRPVERPIRRFSITGLTPPSTRIQRPEPRGGTIGQGNHSGPDRRSVGSRPVE